MSDKNQAIVLMNLGSPDSTEVKDVKKYLNEFLMDERVIDYPYLFRLLLIRGIIVPSRAPKSAEAYRKIWTGQGSPLIVLTEQLRSALEEETGIPVTTAMRYGKPHPKEAFDKIAREHPEVKEVILFPLYPHYAMSSYETAVVYAEEAYKKGSYPFRLTRIAPYYNEAHYLDALAESIRPYLTRDYDHILFSYHGVPERHIIKGDVTGKHCLVTGDCCHRASPAHQQCYRHQCIATTELLAAKLGLPAGKYSFSFQSRLGRAEWLKPYTAVRFAEMPKEGIRKLLVACPAFVSDCLETLEEIAQEGSHLFKAAGGVEFTMIPCLNVHPAWVKAMKTMIHQPQMRQ